MKFLIDMGVGKKVEEWFKQELYDVKNVRDLDIRLKDVDILRLAVTENCEYGNESPIFCAAVCILQPVT